MKTNGFEHKMSKVLLELKQLENNEEIKNRFIESINGLDHSKHYSFIKSDEKKLYGFIPVRAFDMRFGNLYIYSVP